jgi:AraC-like DNA-binding protein
MVTADATNLPRTAPMRRAGRPYRSHIARLFVEHARRRGVEAGSRIAELELPFEHLVELADELAQATGEPFFGLDAATHLPRGAYGIVEYAVATAATLGQAIDTTLRCHALSSELARVATSRAGKLVTFEHWVEHPASARAVHGNEFALATYASIGERAIGHRPRFRAVRFMHHAPPVRRTALERFFDAPVELGAARNALVFDASLLATPIATADPALFGILAAHADRDLALIEPRGELVTEIKATYRRLLVDSPHLAQAHEVARALALSTRSLNRRLAEVGMSFRAIEADVKRGLAVMHLRDGRRSITEIARLVGFTEPSAFIRAFRRWTGKTPTEHREEIRAAASCV